MIILLLKRFDIINDIKKHIITHIINITINNIQNKFSQVMNDKYCDYKKREITSIQYVNDVYYCDKCFVPDSTYVVIEYLMYIVKYTSKYMSCEPHKIPQKIYICYLCFNKLIDY